MGPSTPPHRPDRESPEGRPTPESISYNVSSLTDGSADTSRPGENPPRPNLASTSRPGGHPSPASHPGGNPPGSFAQSSTPRESRQSLISSGMHDGTSPRSKAGETAAGRPSQKKLPWSSYAAWAGHIPRPRLLLVSVLVILASVSVLAAIYSHLDQRTSVLELARSLPAEGSITMRSLTVARVALPAGTAMVPARMERSVIGRRVSAAVGAGTLLAPYMLASSPSVPPGYALVGVALAPGALPADGVAPGQAVMVIETGGSNPGMVITPPTSATGTSGGSQTSMGANGGLSGSPGYAILDPAALVTQVGPAPEAQSSSASILVSLRVPDALAPVVSTAAVASRLSLALVPSSQPGDAGQQ